MVPPVETRQRHVSILFKEANGRFKHPIIMRQRHVSIPTVDLNIRLLRANGTYQTTNPR